MRPWPESVRNRTARTAGRRRRHRRRRRRGGGGGHRPCGSRSAAEGDLPRLRYLACCTCRSPTTPPPTCLPPTAGTATGDLRLTISASHRRRRSDRSSRSSSSSWWSINSIYI